MRTPNRQTVLLLTAGVLAVVFSLGFFAGRNTMTYEVSAQTNRVSAQTAQAVTAPEEKTQTNPEAAAIGEADEAAVSYPIDLNTATLEELMTLPRIGEKLAQRILDYRAEYGS